MAISGGLVDGGDPMVPRVAMMQALQRDKPKATLRRKRAKVYKINR
jgi:hypothetical protein